MKEKRNGRIENVLKNTFWVIVAQSVTVLFSFLSRKIFLRVLGVELLGVNSLFGDVLMIFSFADLGIGVAISFSLYKPIAEGNKQKIGALLKYYKNVYAFVILFVICVGVGFYPFIPFLKSSLLIRDLYVYYTLFLINNVIGYFWAYRESYVMACQHEHKLTIINLIYSIIQYILQIFILMMLTNYFLVLCMGVFLNIIKKIVTNIYVTKYYPETCLKDAIELEREEKKTILTKSMAMLVHKIGNLCINQTDSLIAAYVVSIKQWGLVSNYLMIKKVIATIADKIYSVMIPSMGNLVASEDEVKVESIFNVYDFMNFWFATFCFVSLSTLSSPFVRLMFGNEVVLDDITVFFFFFAFFIDMLRAPVSLMREASGLYEKDKWFTVLAALVNLVFSIVFGKWWQISGIFVGTICAMLVLHISRVICLFRNSAYKYTPIKYLLHLAGYVFVGVFSLGATYAVSEYIILHLDINLFSFFVLLINVLLVPNVVIYILFHRKQYFFQTKEIVVKGLCLYKNRDKGEK